MVNKPLNRQDRRATLLIGGLIAAVLGGLLAAASVPGAGGLIAAFAMLAFLALTLIDIRRALQLYVYALPITYGSLTVSAGPLLLQIYYFLGGALILGWLLRRSRHLPPYWQKLWLPMAIFLAAMIVSGFLSSNWSWGIADALKWMFNFALLFLIVETMLHWTVRETQGFFMGWFLSLAAVILFSLFIFFSPFEYPPAGLLDLNSGLHFEIFYSVGKTRWDSGITWPSLALGFGTDFTQTAGMAMLGTLLGLGLFFQNGKHGKLAIITLTALMFVAVILTLTRAAFIGFFVGAVAMFWGRGKARLLLFAGILLLGIVSFSIGPVRERLLLITAEQSSNRDSRLVLWSGLIEAIIQNPILGVGPRQGAVIATDIAVSRGWLGPNEIRFAAHNPYLTQWAETGTVAFVALLWLIVRVTWDAWYNTRRMARVRHPLTSLAWATIGAFLAWNVFAFFNPQLYPWFWVLIGFAAGFAKIKVTPVTARPDLALSKSGRSVSSNTTIGV